MFQSNSTKSGKKKHTKRFKLQSYDLNLFKQQITRPKTVATVAE